MKTIENFTLAVEDSKLEAESWSFPSVSILEIPALEARPHNISELLTPVTSNAR
jgi:hypothetical protein